MARIPLPVMARSIASVTAMTFEQKEQLVDEIFHAQPHMLGSVLALPNLGVSMEKVEFALGVLLVCFTAMKESGLVWPVITEDDLELQLRIYTATLKLGEDMSPALRDRLMQQYADNHPEKNLCAYVCSETASWLTRISPEGSDKYVMLAVTNLLNCIAYVPMPEHKETLH